MNESERIKLFKEYLESRIQKAEFELDEAAKNQPESYDTFHTLSVIRDICIEFYDTLNAMLQHD